MSSDFYTVGSVGTRNTTARAETVQAQLQAIDDGLALLPGKLPLQQDRVTYAADTGAANAYVVTLDKVPPAYVAGLRVTFKATNANTGASTINVNSLGTKAIQTWDGSALSSGTIAANQLVTVQYDGTAFRIMSMHGGTSISTLAGISADITTVAGISANVTSVAGNATNINAVASNASNINAVAANETNIDAVAANETNIDAVAGISADVTTVATNVADVTNFADVYIGPSATPPATRSDASALQTGDLYFDTAGGAMNVWNGAAWVEIGVSPTTFSDAAFGLQDDGDATKQIAFQLSGITTGTTRTLTVPDASGTIALTSDLPDAVTQEIITSSQSWAVPAGANWIFVQVCGGGGGGGSGWLGGASAAKTGGGGGGGAPILAKMFTASELSSPVSITIGAGGAGGAAQTTSSTAGNNGSAGGSTSFGAYLSSSGGAAGVVGSSSATNGSAGTGFYGIVGSGAKGTAFEGPTAPSSGADYSTLYAGAGGGGTNTATSSSDGMSSVFSCAGGGGGGSEQNSNVLHPPGAGGSSGSYTKGGGATAGTSDASTPVAGTAGASLGEGGGGGGSSQTANGAAGGAGGLGAGGGGGGTSRNGLASGAGGAGGDGFVRILWG